jgi:hypothetical protein
MPLCSLPPREKGPWSTVTHYPMLSVSQKKRLRLRRKHEEEVALARAAGAVEAAAGTAVGTAAEPPGPCGPPVVPESDAPAPTREELQARVQEMRAEARSKRTVSKRKTMELRTTDAARSGKALMDQYRTGTLSKKQMESLAELEKEFYEECRGDATAFCIKNKIDARAIPAIQAAILRVQSGEAPEDTMKETVASLATAMSKKKK